MLIPQPAGHLLAAFQTTHTVAGQCSSLLLSGHLAQCLGNAESDDEDVPRLEGYPLVPGHSVDVVDTNTESAEWVESNAVRVGIALEVDEDASPGDAAARVPVCKG